jgi:hypothetical protein
MEQNVAEQSGQVHLSHSEGLALRYPELAAYLIGPL